MSEKKMLSPQILVYSDGGANPNPGPGGYGIIMSYKGIKKEFSQGYTKTTNNRMELLGVISSLQKIKTPSKVLVHTDSQYTINGISKGWAKKWKANNWFRTKTDKAVNYDLWAILLELTEKHEVTFLWVKGHNGHIENERCDELATQAMSQENLLIDHGFIEKKSGSSNEKKQKLTQALDDNLKKIETPCKKCGGQLLEKIPKHSHKTLKKAYYYAYYHHCPDCKTNYMLEEAKRDIHTLTIK